MAIALMGDLVIASETAFFLQAFRHIGLVPDCGSSWLLPRLVGRARAMELSMLGERLPARKALDWGLINFVVPAGELPAETMRLAGGLAEGPPIALSMTRELYWDSLHNTFEEQLAAEARAQRAAGATRDFVEGVSAYLEKRPPRFSGS
jgi:2-(1,2-epoxy-1,2-dihydrophenyl)acetyl-CoA isomerase